MHNTVTGPGHITANQQPFPETGDSFTSGSLWRHEGEDGSDTSLALPQILKKMPLPITKAGLLKLGAFPAGCSWEKFQPHLIYFLFLVTGLTGKKNNK